MSVLQPSSGWAVQQLAGLLAGISAYDDVAAMLMGATHRIAEAVDAEVCALVTDDGRVPAAIGFPADTDPAAALIEVVAAGGGALEVAGLGVLDLRVVDVGRGPGVHVVLGRSGAPLDAAELHLVRSMTQVVDLALALRSAADRERHLREQSEAQAAELRDVNQRLVEASAAKDAVISVASHELRTPLTSILGFAATLRDHDEELGPGRRKEFLGVIERQGQRLLRLVDDLLTVGRIEAGRLDTRPEVVPVAATAREIVEAAGLDVPLRGDGDLLASVDPDQLEQVLLNLLTNAEKYGAPPVEVEVVADGDMVELAVLDHGPGVPDSFVPHLFERFSQASAGVARESTGAGLGLAIVDGLATANGGEVTYARVDGRTRFAVRLPRRSAEH